jgi:hypothetical protein
MAYSGIDYGMGKTNIDHETGIRYGVINSNELASHAWDTIHSEATDLDYKEAAENAKSELAHAIKSVLEDYSASFDANELAGSIIDDLDFVLESTGDSRRFLYDKDGETFNVLSDGDIMVTSSKFYTLCSFCSPCAPGAGSLGSDGSVKTYCLGPEWFGTDRPMPYACFRVSDDSPVTD